MFFIKFMTCYKRAMSITIVQLFVSIGWLHFSEQLEHCPIEVNTVNYFPVNAAECGALSELKVLCNGNAYCYKGEGFGGARCNKTKDGVNVNIPLERKNCDKLEFRCYDNILLDCELLKHKRPNNVSCTYDVNDENVLITCKAVGIYPGGKCQLQMRFNNIDKPAIKKNERNEINGNLYDASCNFSYPITHYDKSNNVIDISVIPNVTDVRHGHNVSLKISLDLSVSISHCLREYTRVNETIHCTCVRSDDSQIIAQPLWYNRRHELQFNGSPTLFIKAFDVNQGYYCVARKYNISSNIVTYTAVLKDLTVSSGDNMLEHCTTYLILMGIVILVLLTIVAVMAGVYCKACKKPTIFEKKNDGQNETFYVNEEAIQASDIQQSHAPGEIVPESPNENEAPYLEILETLPETEGQYDVVKYEGNEERVYAGRFYIE